MSTDDTDKGQAARDKAERGDEAFFARWSRRKREAASPVPSRRDDAVVPTAPVRPARHERTEVSVSQQAAAPDAAAHMGVEPRRGPLTEDDFKDVDFSKLDYASDYQRFTAAGVPESIRQKALTQLWHSDPIFTAVDPFQDYAGDYTDAAAAAKGAVKTAYRIGQGFLSDDEARAWETLGLAEVAPEIAALPVLRPGYRVRHATTDDAEALAALQAAAIGATAADHYGPDTARLWAASVNAADFEARLQNRDVVVELAIQENRGTIAGFIAREDHDIAALFVAPGHGRRGLARRLIERQIAFLEQPGARGAVRVAATALARPIFARLGFAFVAEQPRTLFDGVVLPLSLMRRPLVTDATLAIAQEDPEQAEVRALLAASEACLGDASSSVRPPLTDIAMLRGGDVSFLVARLDGQIAGCGALVAGAHGRGELTRMWVDPGYRGLRIGAGLLAALEAQARARSIAVVRLVAGIHQTEAIGLYRQAGFAEVGPFGAYGPDPLSLFMEKHLTSSRQTAAPD